MERRKIRNSALQVLAGADYLRTSLLSLLYMGPDSLGSNVYAIKCRVKAEDSLVKKIEKKQIKNPNYTAEHVTDIIGLRLLALTSEHMSFICDRFISFIRFCQNPDISLFVGRSLNDAIKEIIVYKSKANPVVYDKLYVGFQTLNISPNKIALQESTEASPYSSVHLVCYANSFYGKTPRAIPIEVQIRTVFEDAWAEIDHSLRYKGEDDLGQFAAIKGNADELLGTLKDNVDSCLKYADKMNRFFSIISDDMSHRKTIIRMTPFGNRLSYNNLQALPNNIKQIETNLTALFTNSDGISLDKLHPIISEIDKVIKTYETGLCDKDDDSFHEINFIMKMDKALLLTKKGQFLSETNHPIEASDCLREATEIYLSLDRDPRFFREAMLKYRLSSLLLVANEVGSALEKLKQAVALLPNDRRIPKTHILQISIRRQCSYVYWRSKQVIWSEGESVGDVRLRREDQIDLMINAVSLIRKCIEILCNIPESKEKEIESLRVWNNFICFSWEIIDLGHALSMSQEDKVNIGKAIKSINEAIPDYTRQLTALDTLTKAAQSVGDQELQSDYWVAMKKEFRRQSDPKKRTDGYTQSELKYIEYCIEKLKINR